MACLSTFEGLNTARGGLATCAAETRRALDIVLLAEPLAVMLEQLGEWRVALLARETALVEHSAVHVHVRLRGPDRLVAPRAEAHLRRGARRRGGRGAARRRRGCLCRGRG